MARVRAAAAACVLRAARDDRGAGAAWGLWHVPLYFLPGTGQYDDGLFTQQGLTFFLELFPLTFVMLFVSERLRGGVPAAILVHAAWNLTEEQVPPLGKGVWLELLVLTAVAAALLPSWTAVRRGRRVTA